MSWDLIMKIVVLVFLGIFAFELVLEALKRYRKDDD